VVPEMRGTVVIVNIIVILIDNGFCVLRSEEDEMPDILKIIKGQVKVLFVKDRNSEKSE